MNILKVSNDNLVATLPKWGEYFVISMQIWVESHINGWSELLRFTATEKSCCSAGDRIPAFFVTSDGLILVTSHVGTNGNFGTSFKFNLKSWIRVDIRHSAGVISLRALACLMGFLNGNMLSSYVQSQIN